MRRRCDVCGRKFRYPGLSFDPDQPALSDHVHWAHDNLFLRTLPGARDRPAFLSVYRDLCRFGDLATASGLEEIASADASLYAEMRGAQRDP